MKLDFITDLHFEFGPMELNPVGDVLVLAGDIHVGTRAEVWIREACKQYNAVIYVLGNHEFYHHTYEEVIQDWKEIEKDVLNLFVLHNETIVLKGVRFIGTTLWTYGRLNVLNDFAVITKGKKLLTVDDTQRFHLDAIRFLEDTLERPWNGETVVVTHHAPVPECVRPWYVGDFNNCMYHGNLNDIIKDNDIAYWLHGHMHDTVWEVYEDTNIVCNPRGYNGYEVNKGFENPLTLTV